ncbi:hypothetical protein GQ44DRAFT_296899 [Phaeosphaeriaceae sp. PMI808]|nr:hypothetical protein GQ44DRAFT_296899 [Phaeosphaeriaceae sp. PMI808]
MALARLSLDIGRSASIENRYSKMACNIFGLIHIVLIRKIKLNYRMLLTLYFTSTITRLDATSIYWMYLTLLLIVIMNIICSYGNRISRRGDSLLRAGRSNSVLA